jgi:hypothetical protein
MIARTHHLFEPTPTVARRLELGNAVVMGLGSMIGAGVFSAFVAGIARDV